MNADGSNPTRLTFGADNSNSSGTPHWSPDGTRISYEHQIYTEENGNATAQYEIYVMNADGSNQLNLTNSPEDEGSHSWSPDSASIVFVRNEEIFVIPSTGGAPVNVSNHPNVDRLPEWSPNGERIVFISARNDDNEVFTVAPDGSGLLQLTDNSGQVLDRWDYLPNYTTGGSAIAFTRFGDGQTEEANTDIYLMNIDGTSQTNLTNHPAEDSDFAWQPIPPTPPTADVYVSGWADQLYVPNGGQVSYSIHVGSFGPYPASNITLIGQFPSGVTLVSASTASGSCTGAPGDQTFNCTITDTINSYESRLVTVTATATGPPYTPINTTFGVTSAYDNNSSNNSAQAEFYIASPPLPSPTPGPADEAQIAYIKYETNLGQWDIFSQRADGAGLSNLTNHPGYEDKFIWSPDGSRMAFLRFDSANLNSSLCVINADGSNLSTLTNVPNEYIDSFTWSPDGNRLTFNARPYSGEGQQISEIFVINADGTGRASVSGPVGYNFDPEWSPDGARISYTRYNFIPDAPPTSDIYVSNPDGTNQITIANGDSDYDTDVDWSLDGARLAFTRSQPNNTADVYTVRADGSDLRQLTSNASGTSSSSPHWSPDGSKLTFASYLVEGAVREVINADGTGRLVVYTPPANAFSNSGTEEWSPDGTRLVFDWAIGEGLGGNTCIVNVDGTGLHCVGSDLDTSTYPDWSPDGTKIAFLSRRNGVQSIDIINADGTNRVELAQGDVLAPKWRPRPQPNTPAGTNVVVTNNGVQLTFSNVTQAGQTTITPIDPNSLQGIPGEYVINANSLAFEITTTAAYTGPIIIGFQVPGINNPITFSTLRVLHGEPPPVPNFVDRTILAPDSPAHNFPARTIYARVTSLSPFLIAERAGDTTPPNIQITRPTATVYLVNQGVTSSYSCTDNGGSGLATCVGTVANGAAVDTASVGAKVFTVNATDGAGNPASKTVNYTVAYGVKTLHDPTKLHKSGSTVQLELQLVNAAGLNLSSAGVAVTAVSVTRVSSSATGAIEEYNDDDPDSNFTFQNGQNLYRFKLKTTGYAAGTYLLSFRAGNDPTIHTVEFRIRQ